METFMSNKFHHSWYLFFYKMTEYSTVPITGDEQSILDISMNGGFFGLIEMGVMVILMLIIAITKIVSQCKKSKSTEEKLKILQETFDLKAIEKLGIVMKQDGTAVPTETLATIVHTAAQSIANSIQDVTKPTAQTVPATVTASQVLTASQAAPVVQNIVIDKSVIEEAVQKSVQNLMTSQKQTVVQLDASGKATTDVVVQTDKGAIPVKLNISKEKTREVAIEMPTNEWETSRVCFAMDDQLTEYVESDMVAASEMSIMSEITQDDTLANDVDNFRKSLEIDIKKNPTSSEIKINNVENDDGNWDYYYQIYDGNGRELLKSTELLSVSAYRNEIYKETINEMIRESFKNINIADE